MYWEEEEEAAAAAAAAAAVVSVTKKEHACGICYKNEGKNIAMSFRIHIISTTNMFRRKAPLLPTYTLSFCSSRHCFTQLIELTRYLPEHWHSRLTPKNSHAVTPSSERASGCCPVMRERLLSTLCELAGNFLHSGSL
jgi:hypothetical protein